MAETANEAAVRIQKRFDVLAQLTDLTLSGGSRALICSGPAGLGKSFSVEQKLTRLNEKNFKIIKGTVRATGLYKALYDYRKKGQIIVLDDADSIFSDEETLNLLKAACDTSDRRRMSWLSESKLVSEKGESVPASFEYEGSVIFLTNLDFDYLIAKKGKLAPHLEALISRAHYVSMGLHTKRDYLIRISMVLKQGLLRDLSVKQQQEVTRFLQANSDTMRELSLRCVVKLGQLVKQGSNWEEIALITMCK